MKRTLTAILLMTSLLLISCAGDTADSVTTSDSTTETTTAETVSTEPPSAVPEDLDFNGATFTLLGGDAVFTHYTMATELTGDGLNDALFERYQRVGNELNIKFEFLQENAKGAVDKINSTVLAGDDIYQLAIVQRATSIGNMVGSKLLANWNDLPYGDLAGEYWYHDANESLRVGDYIFYTYGDIYPLSAHVMYYNKDIQEAYELASPHSYALEGTWTLDVLYELASQVSEDINGDGVMDANDQYGISFANTDTINSLMYGAGLTISERYGDSIRVCECTDKTVEVFGKVYDLFNNGDICYSKKLNEVKLTTGRVLFFTGAIHGARNYRDAEVEFGVLPYPKYNEEQEHYISFLNTELMCVPTIADKELAGAAIQLLAEESDGVKTGYYDYLLKEKVARDSESKAVLDLIFENAINDFIISYCGGMSNRNSMYTNTSRLVVAGSSDFVSSYERYAPGLQAEIDSVLEMIHDN
nr:extracellular solute-binding protein [Clostridia bacterium]